MKWNELDERTIDCITPALESDNLQRRKLNQGSIQIAHTAKVQSQTLGASHVATIIDDTIFQTKGSDHRSDLSETHIERADLARYLTCDRRLN